MTKNIILAASMTMLVAISGQAFARAASSEQHGRDLTAPYGRQAADTFNAYDAMMPTPPAAVMHRYEGGPKTND